MVVFLAADGRRIAELDEAVRANLAWRWIADHVVELDIPPQQARQVETNYGRTDEAVTSRIAQTYHWALIPDQPDPARPPVLTVEKADGPGERLADRVTEKLRRVGQLTGEVAARSIRLDLDTSLRAVWGRGHVSVGELWSYYCRYPYLTRLRDRSVLDGGIASVLCSITWEQEGFALADAYDENSGQYRGLVLPGGDARFGQIRDTTLLVTPNAALQQRETDLAPEKVTEDSTEPGGRADDQDLGPVPPTPTNRRYFGVYTLDPERFGRDLTRLSQEILQPLTSVDGAKVRISVEIHAERADGFPEDKIRIIQENARTLQFDQSTFEDL
jgi:hypothetical protein